MMNLTEISNLRLINQKISLTECKTPAEIVAWMGAMQAQDYSMVKWAIGLRLIDSTQEIVVRAINNCEIIRTHLLRPTWHFVASEDIYWILGLTSPHIKSLTKSRNRDLELSDEILRKSAGIIENSLSEVSHFTREELAAEFNRTGIRTDSNRLSHLILEAELNGLICNGPVIANKHTYALLNKRVFNKKLLTKDESLAELAKRYFTSHCPATLKDFIWWSGLSVINARQALDSIKTNFISENIGNETYWFKNSFKDAKICKNSVHLLPAYDEYLISYKDRSASLSLTDNRKAVSNNGIFRPVIVVDGQVAGLWKRIVKKDKIIIEINLFKPTNKMIESQLLNIAEIYGKFFDKETVIKVL